MVDVERKLCPSTLGALESAEVILREVDRHRRGNRAPLPKNR